MIPLFEKDGFLICFDALPGEESAYEYFVNFCGWTEEQFEDLTHHDFFTAKVSAWKGGKEFASDYLGACSYENVADFYTTYKDDYFNDMVETVIQEAVKSIHLLRIA